MRERVRERERGDRIVDCLFEIEPIARMRTTYHHQKKTLDGNHDGGDLPWATGIPFSTVTKR